MRLIYITQFVLYAALILIATPGHAKPLKNFEGAWRSCFTLQGERICTGYYLVQKNKNVCGTWEYFATNMMYEGQLQAVAEDKTHAKWTKICGRPGSETHTECAGDTNWENSQKTLQLCNGRLIEGDEVCNATLVKNGYHKQKLKSSMQKSLLATPWVQQCLSQK